MADHLYCSSCQEVLSLNDVIKETRYGLASVFIVKCRKCLAETRVPTGKQHIGSSGSFKNKKLFDVNTKMTLSALHAGVGHTVLDKLFYTSNIPNMSWPTFKKHESEVGPVVESIAEASCLKACKEERELTIKNLEKLQKSL